MQIYAKVDLNNLVI